MSDPIERLLSLVLPAIKFTLRDQKGNYAHDYDRSGTSCDLAGRSLILKRQTDADESANDQNYNLRSCHQFCPHLKILLSSLIMEIRSSSAFAAELKMSMIVGPMWCFSA